jgi:hypothetical protein
MARLRRRFSLGSLMAVVLPLGVVFGCVKPWPLAICVAAGILVPFFISGLNWAEILAILACTFYGGILLIVLVDSYRGSYHGRMPTPAKSSPRALPVAASR